MHHVRNGAEAALVYSMLKELEVRYKIHVYAYRLMGNIFFLSDFQNHLAYANAQNCTHSLGFIDIWE